MCYNDNIKWDLRVSETGIFWGNCEGRLWNGNKCGKMWGNENLKATIPNALYDRSKSTEECGIFKLFGYQNNKLCKIYTLN